MQMVAVFAAPAPDRIKIGSTEQLLHVDHPRCQAVPGAESIQTAIVALSVSSVEDILFSNGLGKRLMRPALHALE